jgi:hypothetical protein
MPELALFLREQGVVTGPLEHPNRTPVGLRPVRGHRE